MSAIQLSFGTLTYEELFKLCAYDDVMSMLTQKDVENIALRLLVDSKKGSSKEVLTVKEASEYLDVKVSTVYSYTHNKTIPFTKPNGSKCYFKKSDLDEFLTREFLKKEAK